MRLAISHSILALLGGSAEIASQCGCGTRVTLRMSPIPGIGHAGTIDHAAKMATSGMVQWSRHSIESNQSNSISKGFNDHA